MFQVGQEVLVHKLGMAMFQAFGHFKEPKKRSGWVDAKPRPWYPHGQVVTVTNVSSDGMYYHVKGQDGKSWPDPIGQWALTDELDFYHKF